MRRAFVLPVALAALVGLVPGPARAQATDVPSRLTVEDAVQIALKSQPRFRAQRAQAQASRDQANSVRGRMLFSVHVFDEYQHWNSPFFIDFGPFFGGLFTALQQSIPGFTLPAAQPQAARNQDTNTFAISGVQPLLGLLHISQDWQAQKRVADAAVANVKVSEAAVREAVRRAYLGYFEARALERVAGESVRELDEQVKVAQARLKAGTITNADLLRVQVAQANARQQVIVAKTSGDVARLQILDAIGVDPAATVELVEPTELLQSAEATPVPDARQASDAALAKRPELQAASLQARAAEHVRKSRLFSLLPDIDLEGAYQRVDGQLFAPQNSAYVGVRANWAIWEWGASFYAERAAKAQAEAAKLELDSQKSAVQTQARSNVAQALAASSAVEVARAAIASAEEAYRVTNALLQAGSATTTDLLDSQAALTTARLNLARAEYSRAQARVSLARSMGE